MEDAIHQSGILDARMAFSVEVYGWDSVTRNLVSIENLNLKLLTVYKSLVVLQCELFKALVERILTLTRSKRGASRKLKTQSC